MLNLCFKHVVRGPKSPLLFVSIMINERLIRELAEEQLAGTDFFLVDVKVSSSNSISVFVDGMSKVSINDCVKMSRHIESHLDRETEDFELMVSSSGMDEPFKVFRQYTKNIGREVDVKKTNGDKIGGKLISVTEKEISLEQSSKEKIEGKKKKELVVRTIVIPMTEIKETRLVIQF